MATIAECAALVYVPLLLTACAAAPTTDKTSALSANIRIEYIQPEKFTDIGDSAISGDASRADDLEQLRRHLAQRAAARLAAGQRLAILITDIDRAGNFEPWHVRLGTTRIIRDIYPPRINLRFELTDDTGAIIQAGERRLRDSAFLTSTRYYRSDPLRYEKALLDDWLERALPQRRE